MCRLWASTKTLSQNLTEIKICFRKQSRSRGKQKSINNIQYYIIILYYYITYYYYIWIVHLWRWQAEYWNICRTLWCSCMMLMLTLTAGIRSVQLISHSTKHVLVLHFIQCNTSTWCEKYQRNSQCTETAHLVLVAALCWKKFDLLDFCDMKGFTRLLAEFSLINNYSRIMEMILMKQTLLCSVNMNQEALIRRPPLLSDDSGCYTHQTCVILPVVSGRTTVVVWCDDDAEAE